MRSVMCGMDSLGLSAINNVDERERAMRTRWGQFGVGAFRYFSGPVWSQKLILGSLRIAQGALAAHPMRRRARDNIYSG